MSAEIFGDLVADMDDELAHLVKEELLTGWSAQKALTAIEAQKAKAISDQIEHCSVDGLGQHVMDVPAEAYFAWKQKLGNDCWSDRSFRDWFKKRNPEVVVNYTPRKTTVLI
jgi:hypothetical protein